MIEPGTKKGLLTAILQKGNIVRAKCDCGREVRVRREKFNTDKNKGCNNHLPMREEPEFGECRLIAIKHNKDWIGDTQTNREIRRLVAIPYVTKVMNHQNWILRREETLFPKMSVYKFFHAKDKKHELRDFIWFPLSATAKRFTVWKKLPHEALSPKQFRNQRLAFDREIRKKAKEKGIVLSVSTNIIIDDWKYVVVASCRYSVPYS